MDRNLHVLLEDIPAVHQCTLIDAGDEVLFHAIATSPALNGWASESDGAARFLKYRDGKLPLYLVRCHQLTRADRPSI